MELPTTEGEMPVVLADDQIVRGARCEYSGAVTVRGNRCESQMPSGAGVHICAPDLFWYMGKDASGVRLRCANAFQWLEERNVQSAGIFEMVEVD